MNRESEIELLDLFLRKIMEKYERLEKEHVEKYGLQQLSAADIRAVHSIGQRRRDRMTSLANHLQLTVGTLTTTIDRLVQKGYVLRQRLEEDRRVVEVRLSDKGTEAFAQIEQSKKMLAERIFEDLDEEDRSALKRIMAKLADK